jgi:hypothetical protein
MHVESAKTTSTCNTLDTLGKMLPKPKKIPGVIATAPTTAIATPIIPMLPFPLGVEGWQSFPLIE